MKIQKPSIGRVVLFHPHGEADVLPRVGIVTQVASKQANHADSVWVHLFMDGGDSVEVNGRYGADESGQPLAGCWCYPPTVREEIEL